MEWILTHLSFRSAYVWIGFICSSSDSDSSKLTLLLNGWETWPTRSWSALFTFTMDWHWRSDADRSIVVWPRLSLSVCVLVLMYCFGTRPYSFSDLNQKTRKLYQFYCFTDPSLNWQPPLQSSHTWLSYARFRASGPVPPVADYCWKTYSLKLERDLARFREKLDVQRTGRSLFWLRLLIKWVLQTCWIVFIKKELLILGMNRDNGPDTGVALSAALAATKKANDRWWTLHTGISIHIVKPVVELARGHQPIFKVRRRHHQVWDKTTVCLRCPPRSIGNGNACQWPLLRYIHVAVEPNTSHD